MATRAVYCQWVREALVALGPAPIGVVYDWIKSNQPVPAADLVGMTKDGQNLFKKKVRLARWTMNRQGELAPSPRGEWALLASKR